MTTLMTTPGLAGGQSEIRAQRFTDGPSLRAWLAGRWAILFSHAADFAQEHLEMDRWISVLSQAFSARGIAAVALLRPRRSPEEGGAGWLAGLSRDCAATLGADIAHRGPRFAMIIDADMRCRRTLRYQVPDCLPSPLELIGWAAALRKRDRTWQSPGEARAHGYGVWPLTGTLAACAQPTAAGAARAPLCGCPPQVQ